MRHFSLGATLHQESWSILKGCTEPSRHSGSTGSPKATVCPGCKLQQGAKLSADQGQAVQSGCFYPNLLRMLQKDRRNNVIPGPKTASVCREVTLLFQEQPRAECALQWPGPQEQQEPVPGSALCIWRGRAPSSCADATRSCQVCSHPQRPHVLPGAAPARGCDSV